jgi:hypothetical protein
MRRCPCSPAIAPDCTIRMDTVFVVDHFGRLAVRPGRRAPFQAYFSTFSATGPRLSSSSSKMTRSSLERALLAPNTRATIRCQIIQFRMNFSKWDPPHAGARIVMPEGGQGVSVSLRPPGGANSGYKLDFMSESAYDSVQIRCSHPLTILPSKRNNKPNTK